MTLHAPIPDDPLDRADAQLAQALARQAEALSDLAEMGMRLARELTEAQPEEPASPETRALAFDRVSRAIRLTFAAHIKALQDQRLRLKSAAFEDFIAEASQEDQPPLAAPKDRAERIVRSVAEAQHGDDPAKVEQLMTRTRERLDRPDREDLPEALDNRSLADLVALICRDLDLDPALADSAIWQAENGPPKRGKPRLSPYDLPLTDRQALRLALRDLDAHGWAGAAKPDERPILQIRWIGLAPEGGQGNPGP